MKTKQNRWRNQEEKMLCIYSQIEVIEPKISRNRYGEMKPKGGQKQPLLACESDKSSEALGSVLKEAQ